uniref:Phospholipase D family member 4 n=1 Tax=Crocodylus porosus TaxID=8502 RepID=A0A7M4FCC6_CROPO
MKQALGKLYSRTSLHLLLFYMHISVFQGESKIFKKSQMSKKYFYQKLNPNDQKDTRMVGYLSTSLFVYQSWELHSVVNVCFMIFNCHCSFELVESVPYDMPYESNSTTAKPLDQAWMGLLNMAQDRIHMVSYYWSLTGKDISVNDSSSEKVKRKQKWLESLLMENVSVYIATSFPTLAVKSTDLNVLEAKGARVRRIDFGKLTNGVLHTKFWIVDMKHIYIGSANMDWRSLSQVKEVGAVIYNCSCLAQDLWKTFSTYWDVGHANASIPDPWPANYSTNINKDRPLEVQFNGTLTKASPPAFCPKGRTHDLLSVISIIRDAQEYVYASVMDYFPTSRFTHPARYWPDIDDALRSVAFTRKVRIRLLISCWLHTDPYMLHYLQSLRALNDPDTHISMEVKLFIVPVLNHTNIPYGRVNHNKYMVTDKVAYFGTSNWSEDYFTTTAGVGAPSSPLQRGATCPRSQSRLVAEQGIELRCPTSLSNDLPSGLCRLVYS